MASSGRLRMCGAQSTGLTWVTTWKSLLHNQTPEAAEVELAHRTHLQTGGSCLGYIWSQLFSWGL